MTIAPLSPDTLPQQTGPDVSTPSDLQDIEFAEVPGTIGSSGPEAPEVPSDLSTVTTRELRILSNQLYRILDGDFPPFGVREDYEAVVEALDARNARAAERTESAKLREKFRDNTVSSRFELFHDGIMVGYVKYDMRAGRIRLLETVVGPTYGNAGLEPVLVREALLSAHRRRLAPVPYCQHAQAFLAENPQYRALIPVG
ncbi:GNAT family N-acetyltransferase [Arthrobacter agilis]|uniref:GNAT family N-acetyltransferase n=1 Tax=Arthrobacter agilis TaxID=37921 RepID=UPI002784FC24|nr:N-acetyltransferase [Arthrobacter agilis]MDQ0735922.1 putative GNAT family acetyltransferase [Arthrobacter agilis]